MGKLAFEEFEQQLADIPEVEPDELDRVILAELDEEIDDITTPLEEIRAYRECIANL